MVLALTAKVGAGKFERTLDRAEAGAETVPKDGEGLPMQIVYAEPDVTVASCHG